ncbi:MAG: hypothetical protein OHK93_002193 [Ramalina farinacea]|uniref:Uncharacterized protein n=1 Tax=Ramalina farinacea TaxID=258253 RepID=A0AA43QU87_9LECA|nr:hypothetical protein [Ramalina farinacea]
MPMSLRKNPPKKEVFEQETPPLSKKIKTTQTPKASPQIGTAHRSTIAPKLPTPSTRGGSVRYIQSPLSISSRNETSGLSSPSAIVKTDKNNGSERSPEQIIWVGDVIQKLAAATDLGPFVRENETKLRRSPCQISLIEAVKALKRWPEDRIPSLALDGELEYHLFPDHDDDTSGADLRTFYGRMIITCLQKKTHPIVPNCGKTLTGYFESGIWNTLLYSAIETIARSSAVIQALESAMTEVMSSWSDQTQDVPNSSQVPSLITDENWTDPSTPTETVRSMSAEAMSSAKPACSYNAHALNAPTSKHTESAVSAFSGSNVPKFPSPAYNSTPSIPMPNIRPDLVRSQFAHSYDTTVHTSSLSSSATCDNASDQTNPHAKGPAIDRAVLQILEGMKAELKSDKASTKSSKISQHPACNLHGVASLERYLTHVKPMVNIILSHEQAKATRDLYRSVQDHVINSASHKPASSEYSPAPAVVPRIPIVPPPGYKVVYHSPYAEFGYGSSGSSTDPGCPAWKDIAVSSPATSPSTKLRLPRLAPKAGRKSR